MVSQTKLFCDSKLRILAFVFFIFILVPFASASFGRPIWQTSSSDLGVNYQGTGDYEVIGGSTNETLYDVEMTKVNILGNITDMFGNISEVVVRKDTKICLTAKWDSFEWNEEYIDKNNKIKKIKYNVPLTLKFKKKGILGEQNKTLIKEKKIDTNYFCYQANPVFDDWLKFGENSIVITQTYTLSTDLNLSKVTAEPIYTHLTVNDSDVVGYWSFDMDNATNVYDLSGNGNDGYTTTATINGSGFINDGAHFDGGDLITVTDSASLGTDNHTISFWVRTTQFVTGTGSFLSKYRTTGGNDGFWTGVSGGDYYYQHGEGTTFGCVSITSAAADGNWHFYTATTNSTSANLYIDGSFVGTDASHCAYKNNSLNMEIGRDNRLASNYLSGDMDEIMIIDRDLTAAEISSLYAQQLPLFETTGTQHYKSFNQTLSAGENLVNVTTTGYEMNNGTNVSLSVGYWQVEDGYDDSDVDLVGSWHLDNESSLGENSTKVFDSSIGNKNNGTVIGATVTDSGKYDGGLNLDGDGDYVTLTRMADPFESSTGHTSCTWIYLNEMDKSAMWLHKGDQAGAYIAIFVESPTLYFQPDFSNVNRGTIDYSTVMSAGQWEHVCMVYDGTGAANADRLKAYFNGVSETLSMAGTIPASTGTSSAVVTMGRYGTSSSYYLNGSMDEVKFYNRSLSANEIKELYTIGKLKYNYAAEQDMNGENQFGINSTSNTFVARYGLNSNSYASYSPYLSDTTIQFTFRNTSESLTTAPNLTFQGQTPANGTIDTSTNKSFIINISVVDDNLDVLTYNWNGTNYTLFNDNLVLMYNFGNRSALDENGTDVADLSGYGNTGYTKGDAIVNATGKYGSGLNLDGVDDYVLVDDSTFPLGASARTMSAWIKWDGTAGRRMILGYGSNANTQAYGYILNLYSSGGIVFVGYNAGDTVELFNITANTWVHLISTYNGTDMATYANGTLIKTQVLGLNTVSSSGFRIGWGYDSDTNEFAGTIDEVRIWDRALNESEINFLYRSNLQWFNDTDAEWWINQTNVNGTALDDGIYTYYASGKDSDYPDANETWTGLRSIEITTPGAPTPDQSPVTILKHPTNNTLSTNDTIWFSANFTDDFNLANATLYVWNLTTYEIVNLTEVSMTGVSGGANISVVLPDGNYSWNYLARDNLSQSAWNDTNWTVEIAVVTITPDTTFPNVTNLVQGQLNDTNYTKNRYWFINFTATDETGLSYGQIEFNGINYTILNSTASLFNFSIRDLGVGAYNYRAWANDTSNNVNDTETGSFTISRGTPEVNLTLRGIDGNITANQTDSINVTGFRVTGEGNIELWQDGALINNGSTGSIGNITTLNSLGIVNFTTCYEESANYTRICEEHFVLVEDNVLPVPVIQSPENLTYNVNNISINLSATDTNLDSIWFYNGSVNLTYSVNTSSIYSEGQHTLIAYANDTDNNINETKVTFFIDTVTPVLGIQSPENKTYSVNNISINLSAVDTNLDSIWFYNGSANLTYTINTSVIYADGQHTFIAYANDSANNVNETKVIFLIDTITPVVSVQSPENVSYNYNNLSINLSAVDTNLDSIWYYNGTTNLTYSGNTSNVFPEGQTTFIVYANDTANNINETKILFFVDSITPVLGIQSPENITYSTTNISINLSATDTNLDSIWYYNGTANLTYTVNTSIIYAEGQHTIIVYANDSVGNLNETKVTFIVDTTYPQVSSLTESPDDPSIYSSGKTYYFNSTVTNGAGGIDTVMIEFGGVNYSVVYSGSNDVYNWSIDDLGANTYNYIWWANDTSGNINNTEIGTYTISKNSTIVYAYINNSRADLTIYGGDANNTNVSGWFNGVGNLELYSNDTLLNNGTTSYISNVTNFTLGTFLINATFWGNENYTVGSEEWTLTVTPTVVPTGVTGLNSNDIILGYNADLIKFEDNGLEVTFRR